MSLPPRFVIAFQGGLRESFLKHKIITFFPFLSHIARYQNELAGVDTELLAERFYYQALSVAPQIGKCLIRCKPVLLVIDRPCVRSHLQTLDSPIRIYQPGYKLSPLWHTEKIKEREDKCTNLNREEGEKWFLFL